uniref:Uncharacterized protein n=1 Tax=Haptolina brevifila TaxID=156173 RepID=A0A7S2FSM6_9EUKA
MWEPLGIKRNEYDSILRMLCRAGVLVLTENSFNGRRWCMPQRLPIGGKHEDDTNAWVKATDKKKFECLRMIVSVGDVCPPGVLEKLLTACQGYGSYLRVWRGGAHMKVSSLQDVSHLLIEMCEIDKAVAGRVRRFSSEFSSFKTPGAAPTAAPASSESTFAVAAEGDTAAAAPSASGEEGAKAPSGTDVQEEMADLMAGGSKKTEERAFELRLEACGKKGATKEIWASLMHIKKLAQAVIDQLPGLPKRVNAAVCCPRCIAQGLPEIGHFQLRQIVKQDMNCERCGELMALHTADLAVNRVVGMSSQLEIALVEPKPKEQDLKFVANRMRSGRPLEHQVSLYKQLGLTSVEQADELKAEGEAGIMRELLEHYNNFDSFEAMQASRDEYEWTDYDWSRYLNDAPGEEETAKMAAYNKLLAKAKSSGFDATYKKLDAFVSDPQAQKAGLNRAHVLALRLYSSTVSRCINHELHAGCSPARRHPYPTLVLILVEALHKLCAAQSTQRQAAVQKAAQLAELARKAKDDPDADDTDKAKAVKKAKDAAAASSAMQCTSFWKAAHSIDYEEFADRSAVEVGFMSVTSDKTVASDWAVKTYMLAKAAEEKRIAEEEAELAAEAEEEGRTKAEDKETEQTVKKADAPVLLFQMATTEQTTPADISFVSVFPKESEWVLPPGIMLEKHKDYKEFLECESLSSEGERAIVESTVVEVFPRLPRREDAKKKPIGGSRPDAL